MKTDIIQIVELGRGPQLSTTRITVLDIFYYLHRGYDFDSIQEIMPTLSRVEFDVVHEYVKTHQEELVEKDREAEEFIRLGIAEQSAKGLCPNGDEAAPLQERVARLRSKMRQRAGEKNREGHSG